jgi:hypothetical protein
MCFIEELQYNTQQYTGQNVALNEYNLCTDFLLAADLSRSRIMVVDLPRLQGCALVVGEPAGGRFK